MLFGSHHVLLFISSNDYKLARYATDYEKEYGGGEKEEADDHINLAQCIHDSTQSKL